MAQLISMTVTYVYDQAEVKWTGRTAVSTRPSISAVDNTMYEITPIDQIVGSWKKWVRSVDLFKICEPEK